jgi:hypothetical protein
VANARRCKSILQDLLEVSRSFAQISVDGVGIGNRQSRIILEFDLDVSKSHGIWKNPGIDVEEAFFPKVEARRNVFDMVWKGVPFREWEPVSCFRQFVKSTKLGNMRNTLECPGTKLMMKNLLKAYRSHLGYVQLVMAKYANQEPADRYSEVAGGKKVGIQGYRPWRSV